MSEHARWARSGACHPPLSPSTLPPLLPCRLGEVAWPPPAHLGDGYALEVTPNGTKCRQGERVDKPVTFTYRSTQSSLHQYAYMLGLFYRRCAAAQQAHPQATVRSAQGCAPLIVACN